MVRLGARSCEPFRRGCFRWARIAEVSADRSASVQRSRLRAAAGNARRKREREMSDSRKGQFATDRVLLNALDTFYHSPTPRQCRHYFAPPEQRLPQRNMASQNAK